MTDRRVLLRMGVSLLLLWGSSNSGAAPLAARASVPVADKELREFARQGLDSLMDGDLDGAIKTFRDIQEKEPRSPLGYLLEAEAIWWKIYLSTAALLDPDLFDVAPSAATPYDSHFRDLVNTGLSRAGALMRAERDSARNRFYQGMAYALDARLAGLRGQDLSTARSGKKMRADLLNALKIDPDLKDAYLGLGIYNYVLDTMPTALKVLELLVGLQGGNRRAGLEQLQEAAEKGELTREEAKFYLAKYLSHPREAKYARSLELFQELSSAYPHNPLWPLVAASLRFKLGQVREGEALYREVLERTSGKTTDVDQAVNRAARQALARSPNRAGLN